MANIIEPVTGNFKRTKMVGGWRLITDGGEFFVSDPSHVWALGTAPPVTPEPVDPPVVTPPIVTPPVITPPVVVPPVNPPTAVTPNIIFDDGVGRGWTNNTWSAHNSAFKGATSEGVSAFFLAASGPWVAHNFNHATLRAGDFDYVEFDVAFTGVDKPGNLFFELKNGTSQIHASVAIALPPTKDTFKRVRLSLKDDLKMEATQQFTNFYLFHDGGSWAVSQTAGTVIDRVRLVPRATALPDPAFEWPAQNLLPPTTWGKVTVNGNKILVDGVVWQGRGVNMNDVRNCTSCNWNAPDWDDVIRKLEFAKNTCGVNVVRFMMETYSDAWGAASGANPGQWKSLDRDEAYALGLRRFVERAGQLKVHVILTPWDQDQAIFQEGMPIPAKLKPIYAKIMSMFANTPHVILALCNEPEGNYGGENDVAWRAVMADMTAFVRECEAHYKASTPHMVLVEGIGGWGRRLAPWVANPLPASLGPVAYGVHPYNPATEHKGLVYDPALKIPVVCAEFGDVDTPGIATMSAADSKSLRDGCNTRGITWLAWIMAHNCSAPSNRMNMLQPPTPAGCGVGMNLALTPYGTAIVASIKAK